MAAGSIPKRQPKAAVDGEALYQRTRRSGPVITDAEIDEITRFLNDPHRHTWRRAAFGVQSMSGEDLFSKIETDRHSAVVFAQAALEINDYVEGMRTLADLINGAQLRIELALCGREDCQAVRAEAKKARTDGHEFERFLQRVQGDHGEAANG